MIGTDAAPTGWLEALLLVLALPRYGLSTVFFVALLSSTLLPLGSEPVVFGLIRLNPELFWPVMAAATAGGTVGGGISWAVGYGAERAYERITDEKPRDLRALAWLKRFGPKACLLSWLPGIGDPLSAVAGWLRLPFWPCLAYMAIGKFARYVVFTALLLWVFPGAGVPDAVAEAHGLNLQSRQVRQPAGPVIGKAGNHGVEVVALQRLDNRQ